MREHYLPFKIVVVVFFMGKVNCFYFLKKFGHGSIVSIDVKFGVLLK